MVYIVKITFIVGQTSQSYKKYIQINMWKLDKEMKFHFTWITGWLPMKMIAVSEPPQSITSCIILTNLIYYINKIKKQHK